MRLVFKFLDGKSHTAVTLSIAIDLKFKKTTQNFHDVWQSVSLSQDLKLKNISQSKSRYLLYNIALVFGQLDHCV